MRSKSLDKNRSRTERRRRDEVATRRQYSLFDATVRTPPEDAQHFRRQAQLCERLLSSLHQPELVEMIGRLRDEHEAAATRIEASIGRW
jgi:hypothetical protein